MEEISLKKPLMIFLLKEVEMGDRYWGPIQLAFPLEISCRELSSLLLVETTIKHTSNLTIPPDSINTLSTSRWTKVVAA